MVLCTASPTWRRPSYGTDQTQWRRHLRGSGYCQVRHSICLCLQLVPSAFAGVQFHLRLGLEMTSSAWRCHLLSDGTVSLTSSLTVGGNAVSAFLSWRLQATNACDVTLVWKSGFDNVSQYGISFKYVAHGRVPDHVTVLVSDLRHPIDPSYLATNGSNLIRVCDFSLLSHQGLHR